MDTKFLVPSSHECPECAQERIDGRGILVINCLEENSGEWFDGYPCLVDYFNKIDGKEASQISQLMDKMGVSSLPMIRLSDDSEE